MHIKINFPNKNYIFIGKFKQFLKVHLQKCTENIKIFKAKYYSSRVFTVIFQCTFKTFLHFHSVG